MNLRDNAMGGERRRRVEGDGEPLLPFQTEIIDLEGDRTKKQRSLQAITADAHTLRAMSIATFMVVLVTTLIILTGVIMTGVVVSRIVGTAQTAIQSAEAILRKPELASTIENINSLVSDKRITASVARVNEFMQSPEISNILSTVNGVIERLPEVEAKIMPLVASEIGNITAVVDRYMTAASSFDPIETINYLQNNRLLERVVAVFNLVDRLSSSEQLQRLQELSTKLETILAGLQEHGVTVHL